MPLPKNSFGQIAAITTFTVDPEDRPTFVSLTLQHCERSLREELHTIQMELLVLPDDESSVVLFGIFLDKDAFADHLKGDRVKEHFGLTGKMIKSANIVQYVIAC